MITRRGGVVLARSVERNVQKLFTSVDKVEEVPLEQAPFGESRKWQKLLKRVIEAYPSKAVKLTLRDPDYYDTLRYGMRVEKVTVEAPNVVSLHISGRNLDRPWRYQSQSRRSGERHLQSP